MFLRDRCGFWDFVDLTFRCDYVITVPVPPSFGLCSIHETYTVVFVALSALNGSPCVKLQSERAPLAFADDFARIGTPHHSVEWFMRHICNISLQLATNCLNMFQQSMVHMFQLLLWRHLQVNLLYFLLIEFPQMPRWSSG